MNNNCIREKIATYGPLQLKNEELLKVLLNGENDEKIKRLLSQYTVCDDDDDFNECANVLKMASLPFDELKAKGSLSDLEAARIVAAVELGIRISTAGKFTSRYYATASAPESIYNYISPRMRYLDHEEFVVLLLNCKNKIIGSKVISTGSVTGSIVDPKAVYSYALQNKSCTSVIAIHNHPSGDSTPSIEDRNITKLLLAGAMTLGLIFADHIIIGDGEYFSFQESNLLNL